MIYRAKQTLDKVVSLSIFSKFRVVTRSVQLIGPVDPVATSRRARRDFSLARWVHNRRNCGQNRRSRKHRRRRQIAREQRADTSRDIYISQWDLSKLVCIHTVWNARASCVTTRAAHCQCRKFPIQKLFFVVILIQYWHVCRCIISLILWNAEIIRYVREIIWYVF